MNTIRYYMIVTTRVPEHCGRVVEVIGELTEAEDDEYAAHPNKCYFSFSTFPELRNKKGQLVSFGMEDLVLMPDESDDEQFGLNPTFLQIKQEEPAFV